jgi:hypothetical protein
MVGAAAAAWALVGCDLGTPATTYDVPGDDVAAGDINGDGHLDLFAGLVPGGTTGNFLVNDGSGGFTLTPREVPSVPTPGQSAQPQTFALADANGDGLDDLLIGNPWEGQFTDGTTVWLLPNDGQGGFGPPVSAAEDQHPKGFTGSITWDHGDVDGDGDLDLVVLNSGVQRAITRLGDGAGGFGPGATTTMPFSWFAKVQLADVNADGLDDFVAAGTALVSGDLGGWVVVGPSDGSGAFPNPATYRSIDPQEEDGIEALAVGDLDGDGDQDLIGAVRSNNPSVKSLSLNLGNGDGTFAPAVARTVPFQPRQIAAADVDGDGQLDVLVVRPGATKVLFGDGTTRFPRERDLGSAGTALVVELNGDGAPDVVFRNPGKVTVYLNAL